MTTVCARTAGRAHSPSACARSYCVVTARSAPATRVAALRMLRRGEVRVKEPLATGGRGQTLVATIEELDALLERLAEDDITKYGIVLEENLRHVTTRSVGSITVDDQIGRASCRDRG